MRLIDGDALEVEFRASANPDWTSISESVWMENAADMVKEAPTIEQKSGQWLLGFEVYYCSACGKWINTDITYAMEPDVLPNDLPKYCPYCGAEMADDTGWSDKLKASMEDPKTRRQSDLGEKWMAQE